ncbi:hypothetical protein PR048_019971 [Dryococelus australis]|uniref:Uncharacterized protein n=1 Tax=Dryococelus australis TaxID=614101 RepID=A0ABQ9H4Y8_9NEOP|nr:hypothetical protein PR048_019971 [Dryococelus australis]
MNIMEKEILTRIQAGNILSFLMGKMLKSKLSRTTKLRINKTIIQPVVLYVEWRKRKNRELRNLYQLPNIVAVIKGQRLRWYGHKYLVKDVVERGFLEKSPRGRPRLRWLDAIKEDIRKAYIPEQECRDRALWRRLVVEAMDRLLSVMPL